MAKAPKKKSLKAAPPATRASALVARLQANRGEGVVYTGTDIQKGWKYIDFTDPKTLLPSIGLEWAFGARGLLAGRIMRLQAGHSVGKTSLMWLMYGSAQANAERAWCTHLETEGATPTDDYIYSYGCDPDDLAIVEPESLEHAFEMIDNVVCEVRGSEGISVNSSTGRRTKSKFTEALDPKMESPMLIGVDSFSALGLEAQVEQDVLDMTNTPAVAGHSRKMSEYLRDRVGHWKKKNVLMMLAAQEKTDISSGGGWGGPKKSSLGSAPIGFHATYGLTMFNQKHKDGAGKVIGDAITIKTEKNKIAPKNRELTLYLVTNNGFDLRETDYQFLLKNPASPLKLSGNRNSISCPALGLEKLDRNDFLQAFYENKDALMHYREELRIRGFDFDFEKRYKPSQQEVEDNKVSAESDISGLEGSKEEV